MSTRARHILFAALVIAAPPAMDAQAPHSHGGTPPVAADSAGPDAASSVNAAMAGRLVETPHLRLTPRRPESAEDAPRASTILRRLRGGIEKYRDHRVALAEGYQIFLPHVPQKVYHFTNNGRAIRSAFRFDAAAPTSLLYEKTSEGEFLLVGAMYTAPRRASIEDLNRRVPLSAGQWHLHTNLCFPPRDKAERFAERRNGEPLFGPLGSISTEAACEAEGGRFFPHLFGWMLHVNAFAKDPTAIWGEGHEHKH